MMSPLRTGPRGDLALLAVRLVLGLSFVLHGLPKIQHPVSWLAATLPAAPGWLAAVAAFAEFGGGIALVAGLATPLFAFLIACDMTVAIFFVLVPRGATFVSATGGPTFERELAYLVMAVALVLMGAGAYSIDGANGAGGRGGRTRRGRR